MSDISCVVAAESATLTAIYSGILKKAGITPHTTTSGLEALSLIHRLRPACALLSTDLTDISGYNLCRIIKNTKGIEGTQIVLCTTEDTTTNQYWAENSNADGFFVPDPDNADTLPQMLLSLTQEAETLPAPAESDDVPELSRLFTDAVGAMETDLFNLYLIRNAYESTGTFSVKDILNQMVRDIKGIVPYDILGIIIYDMNLYQYYQRSSRLSSEEVQDFIQVCRADAEKKALGISKFAWDKTQTDHHIIYTNGGFDSIRCYESFPSQPSENLLFSLHIGSFTENVFRTRNSERIHTLISVYEKLLAQTIEFQRAKSAESNMRRAFSRFVPDSIIEDAIAGGAETQQSVGEKRKVAVMLTDIRNFTPISEINKPEEVVAFLNSFFAVMGRIIKKHGGIIDKFMGDCIMALFGAPESYPDNANRAATAAIEMHQALKQMSMPLNMPEGVEFAIGTGIHYGEAIVGSIGSDDKREYTVIGDSVNIASRVEGLTKLYGVPIVITNSVKEDLRSGQKVRHLDNVRVKGKSIAIPVYGLQVDDCDDSLDNGWQDNYAKGLHQYSMGNFTTAEKYFYEAHNLNPQDKASMVMLGRCEEFMEHPPEDWDGSIALSTKG